MRVVLMHNEAAGSDDHGPAHVMERIRAAGHEVVGHFSKPEALPPFLDRCDLVVVAGGDGTMNAVAKRLVGSGMPLALIPLGTANNVARALGLARDIDDVIHAWAHSDVRPFDAATATFDGQPHRFFEGFGFGPFPKVMLETAALPRPDDPVDTLERDRKLIRGAISESQPSMYTVTIDGVDRSGPYVLVEVMNIPYLGPKMAVAPHADPGDGRLDVLLVTEEQRRAVVEHIDALGRGSAHELGLPMLRGSRIRVSAAVPHCHHDGEMCKEPEGHGRLVVDIDVEPAALAMLAPRPTPS